MGAIGSGRRYWQGAHSTVEDFRSLDVRRLQRDGLLVPGIVFNWQWISRDTVVASINVTVQTTCVYLAYRHQSSGRWKNENYAVALEWTRCNLGGQRPWFRCPALGCGRRVAILYGGAIFACRRCHRLAYPSQRESWDDRAARRADRIRARLGWKPGILNGKDVKPRGMHWRTFLRLTARHDALATQALRAMAQQLGMNSYRRFQHK